MADTAILSSAMLTTGSTVAASMLPHRVNRSPKGVECVKGELPSFRMLIGQSLVFIGLGMISPGAPKLARNAALVIGFTAATYYGLPILTEVFNGKGLCTADEPAASADSTSITSLGSPDSQVFPNPTTITTLDELTDQILHPPAPDRPPAGSTSLGNGYYAMPRGMNTCPAGWDGPVTPTGNKYRRYANRIVCHRP